MNQLMNKTKQWNKQKLKNKNYKQHKQGMNEMNEMRECIPNCLVIMHCIDNVYKIYAINKWMKETITKSIKIMIKTKMGYNIYINNVLCAISIIIITMKISIRIRFFFLNYF